MEFRPVHADRTFAAEPFALHGLRTTSGIGFGPCARPAPQIDPHRVATAILKAATEPTRDIKVGMMSKINTAAAKIAPTLAEKMAAMQTNRQQYDQPPSRDPQGGLWQASGGGDIYGHRPAP
jgi:hypothetical protein